jgi:hypothetical protein
MMKPTLYRSYQRADIDMLLSKKAPPLTVADAFLVAPKLLICLANTAASERSFTFTRPSELTWSPKAGSPEEPDRVTGRLSEPLEKALASRTCQRLLFATGDGVNYQYVGEIGLSSVEVREHARRVAIFYLTPKLSLDAWSQFGSYSHWQLRVNGRTESLSKDADLAAALLPEWELDIVDVLLRRYEEDYLHLVANGDSAVVTYTDQARGVAMSSRNAKYSGKPCATIPLTGFDHADWETAARDVVSKGEALELLKAFFRTEEPRGLVPTK